MTRILFLGSKNACRSQMAEAFAASRQAEGVEVVCAGIEAGEMNPVAIRAMADVGIGTVNRSPQTLDALENRSFDIVIVVSAEAAEKCPVLPGHPLRIDWNIPDPEAVKGDDDTVWFAFRSARDEIRRLVEDLFERGYIPAFLEARRCASVILDNVSDGILAHDMDRKVFFFNRSAERITGYTSDEAIGRDCHDVFPGNFCGGKCHFCDGQVDAAEPWQDELGLVTKAGETRRVEVSVRPMVDGHDRQIGVLVSFHDVTREWQLAQRVGEVTHYSGIVGRDKRMIEVYNMISEVAVTNVPVLIQGDSGTGKELVAAAIHNESTRANGLFVPVNCGALPEGLLESELFGHVKGAFTGAVRDKKGRFELADGGTIFLDEIGDISPNMQVKLMRVLQEGSFEPVGSEKTVEVDVRVISATNKDLQREIAEGRFRDDLYYRLNVVPIHLPKLRERRNDIPLLVEHVLQRALKDQGRSGVSMSPDALDIMMSYDWPGNIRELQNWIQFALVKCRVDVIQPEHLPPTASGDKQVIKRRRRRKLDIGAVRAALEQAAGSKVEAARILGVSRATLYRFLEEMEL